MRMGPPPGLYKVDRSLKWLLVIVRVVVPTIDAHQSPEWQCAMAEILSYFGSHNGHLMTNADLTGSDLFHSSSELKLSQSGLDSRFQI